MKTSIPKLHSIKWKNGLQAENVHIINHNMDIPVDRVLSGAYSEGLREVVLFGYDQNGGEYIASSSTSKEKSAFMFGRGQLFLMGG